MVKGKREYPSDVAIAYKGKYEAKNGKPAGTYLKVILKEDLAAGSTIIAFPKNRDKKNETDPDFGFQLSTKEVQQTSKAKSSSVKQASNDDLDF